MATSRLYGAPYEFILRLRQRMPMNVGFTFTDEQLAALSHAFGDRFCGHHAVDMRGRLRLPWSRYYLVFQAGRDQRTSLRRGAVVGARRSAIGAFLCGFALSSVMAGTVWLAVRLLF
ncbi:MAG TPA: hypothetical protein VME47_20545 [Acetobacteraceae bacterium]|nr:hypothetical protein [Acetobacteraceae bacterium]